MVSIYSKAYETHLGSLGEPDLESLGTLWPHHEADEPLPFGGQGVAVLFGQGLERLDTERYLLAGSLRLPRSSHEAIDEHGGQNHAVLGGDHLAVIVVDNTCAIRVGEDQVVKLGQEAWRGRSVRAGPWGVGQVEQFLALLVAKGAQA